MRIARELNDALGHQLSLISVHAGVALHLNQDLPTQARGALAAIHQASNRTEIQGEVRVLPWVSRCLRFASCRRR